jgi:GNAT superfamily N-acetyltransferase
VVLIRALTAADIPAGQRLREQAGWNQTTDDWLRLLAWDAAGCWVAQMNAPDGPVVGTTAVTSYGNRIAWVGMVLVDEAHRRQGIGQTLLTHALAYLEARGVQTVALDSTPAGQPLYARLGFADAFQLARWRGPFPELAGRTSTADGPGTANSTRTPAIRPMRLADLPAVASYDAHRFGTDRAHIPGRCWPGTLTVVPWLSTTGASSGTVSAGPVRGHGTSGRWPPTIRRRPRRWWRPHSRQCSRLAPVRSASW